MDTNQLMEKVCTIADQAAKDETVMRADADIIVFLLDHCDISFPENSVFFGNVNCSGMMQRIAGRRIGKFDAQVYRDELRRGVSVRAFSGGSDFGHTAPLWDDILKLGLTGLRDRVSALADDSVHTGFAAAEYDVLNAAIRFVLRAADTADQSGKNRIASGLRHLAANPPATLFEAMQMIFVWYTLQHRIEGTNVRTLGRLDRLFMPFMDRMPAVETAPLIEAFLSEINDLHADANIPFMLCGSDEDGHDLTNEASYEILRAYIRLKPDCVKFHILCTALTPDDFLELALDGVRSGANSMVFLGDDVVIRSLKRLGQPHAAAVDYSVVGCYECGGREETACTCNGRVSLPKAVELALHGGCDGITGEQIGPPAHADYPDFEALYAGFLHQLSYLIRCSMEMTDGYEAHYEKMHASPFFTATYPTCLKNGGDVYCHHSTPYPNSSVNALGLATAVDSLLAIRKLVYEEKRMTLPALVSLLDSDWAADPLLRERILRKYPKYGNGDMEADSLSVRMVQDLSDRINGVPNAKGGVWRLGLFSIDWRLDFGRHTAASADGRHSGTPLSQNTGASFGADREGATAHLLSVSSIDAANVPNGAIIDLDLHSSAVRGKNGLTLLLSALKTYLGRGGFAVHINVLDTAVLRDAQVHPEQYPNLQVRLCGWNVRFTELSPAAQEEFIRRSERGA